MSRVNPKNTTEMKATPLEIFGFDKKVLEETIEKLHNCIMPKICNNKYNTEKQTNLNQFIIES
jgi:hypothetical protein